MRYHEKNNLRLQPIIGLNPGTPLEEPGEGRKELKGIATPQEEQYQVTGPPKAPKD